MILEDVALLGLKPDVFTFTSDHFERILGLCARMLESGKAYVDDTDAETMKKEREERVESAARSNCKFDVVASSNFVVHRFNLLLRRVLACSVASVKYTPPSV